MNTFLKLGLIAATALSVFAGCAADAEKDASSESDVTSRGRPGFGEGAGAQEGAACGTGIAGIFVACQDGLQCVYPDTKPGAGDVMGQCKAKGSLGAYCGRGNPCSDGLVCEGVGPNDAPGRCVLRCGGIAGIECPATFVCIDSDPMTTDDFGHCEPTAFGE